MKSLLIAVVALFSMNTFAEKISCLYTEPFLSVLVELDRGAIYVNELGTEKVKKERIESAIEVNGVLNIVTKNTMLTIDKNNKGNDGMSDEVYDYDTLLNHNGHKVYGGCNKINE